MRQFAKWLLIVVACVAMGGARAEGASPPGRLVVVVAAVQSRPGGERDAAVEVIAGVIKGRGWSKSEQVGPLLKRGDRFDLYVRDPSGVVVGEVELSDNGSGPSEEWGGWGWQFKGRLSKAFGASAQFIGVWRASDSPAPKWVAWKEVGRENSTYKAVISKWLQSRGIPRRECAETWVWQIVKADLNGDGRDEVLMSFHSPGSYLFNADHTEKYRYSYLLMRYVPGKSKRVKTVVLDTDFSIHTVIGLCDLDGDGWAEVITENGGEDYGDTLLYHWNGKQFQLAGHVGAGL